MWLNKQYRLFGLLKPYSREFALDLNLYKKSDEGQSDTFLNWDDSRKQKNFFIKGTKRLTLSQTDRDRRKTVPSRRDTLDLYTCMGSSLRSIEWKGSPSRLLDPEVWRHEGRGFGHGTSVLRFLYRPVWVSSFMTFFI